MQVQARVVVVQVPGSLGSRNAFSKSKVKSNGTEEGKIFFFEHEPHSAVTGGSFRSSFHNLPLPSYRRREQSAPDSRASLMPGLRCGLAKQTDCEREATLFQLARLRSVRFSFGVLIVIRTLSGRTDVLLSSTAAPQPPPFYAQLQHNYPSHQVQ
ncbi:hypothetical protein Tsp_08761 [Trichinella spiralis]|uniref:hypothetical protein n=1 Tax=Trichinella spiralis TaxID=6334 RepID=UPI0001EFE307|nr:hypothetical protein Tsp_08761 [Trichinella spiralis]